MATFRNMSAAEELKKAAEYLDSALSWSATPEGGAYWEDIYNRLLGLSRQAKAEGRTAPLTGVPSSVDGKGVSPTPLTEEVIHLFHNGGAVCQRVKGDPRTWPVGHTRVGLEDLGHATCSACIEMGYVIRAQEQAENPT